MKLKHYCVLFLLPLAGCGEQQTESTTKDLIMQVEPRSSDAAPQNQFGFYEAMETGPDLFGETVPRARMAQVNIPDSGGNSTNRSAGTSESAEDQQIAYSYGYGFQIDGDKVVELQSAHVSLCEAMGADCRILRTSQASSDGWDGYGELRLEVAATVAGDFGSSLSKPAEELGGELISSVRDGEDLSENIIDAEARLQSRLILRQKLTKILEGSRGGVAELIAAEKAVADVNEEIDSTRSKLAEYRNRIRYSDVRIEYEPYFGQTQLGFGRPVMTALRSIGTTLGTTCLLYTSPSPRDS